MNKTQFLGVSLKYDISYIVYLINSLTCWSQSIFKLISLCHSFASRHHFCHSYRAVEYQQRVDHAFVIVVFIVTCYIDGTTTINTHKKG